MTYPVILLDESGIISYPDSFLILYTHHLLLNMLLWISLIILNS